MSKVIKTNNLIRRKTRVRSKILGTSTCPRLSIRRTNTRVIIQLIDDSKGVTLAYASDFDLEKSGTGLNKSDRAVAVGKLIGEKGISAGIKQVVFDRNGYLYHGRVQKVAEGARSSGLKF